MSMESVTTVLNGVTRPKPDLEPEPKRLKSEPELGSEQEPKLTSETKREEPISEEPRRLKPALTYETEEARKILMRPQDYINQSPYDATPPPRDLLLFGRNPVTPLAITECNRPILKKFSQLALEYYNNKEGSGASFEFHDLVKFTFWSDVRPKKHLFARYHRPRPTDYFITFQAKAIGDTSSSPAITIFQAKVSVDENDKYKPPFVEECRIKI